MPVLAVFCASKIISVSVTYRQELHLSLQAGTNWAFEWLQNRQLQIASGRFKLWMQGMGKLRKAGR